MATYGFGVIDSANEYIRNVRPLMASDVDRMKAGRRSDGRILVIVFPDQATADTWSADLDSN